MADYHKMYLHLFNEVTRAINVLQDAQATAEEMYISSQESVISLSELGVEEPKSTEQAQQDEPTEPDSNTVDDEKDFV